MKRPTRILAVTGSLSLAAKNLISIAIAGSISKNTLDATTESFAVGANVRQAGSATASGVTSACPCSSTPWGATSPTARCSTSATTP